jgi:hypothetical protein
MGSSLAGHTWTHAGQVGGLSQDARSGVIERLQVAAKGFTSSVAQEGNCHHRWAQMG